jgi:DNA-binding Lrp family transcriptional regulator
MDTKVLKILADNARCTVEDIATMTGLSEDDVKKNIKELEEAGIIRGYKTVIDWEKLDNASVSALIELKVIPQEEFGFEKVAETIMRYKEVESVYLMSGSYDLCVIVKGKTFQNVAMFVAKELATMHEVTSTATHFVLRRYKELDVELVGEEQDDRGAYSL